MRFNTTEAEIREANPILPAELSTLPPGMPMQIPIYYQPFVGQFLPDIARPPVCLWTRSVGFDTVEFCQQPAWLAEKLYRRGGGITKIGRRAG